MNLVEIIRVTSDQDYKEAARLIREYADRLNFDLSFQNFEDEMNSLPIMYNERDGGLFLAHLYQQPAGVVGLRRFNDADGEIKRMFVREQARGNGIGKMLLKKCIETARALNYATVKLDTTDTMQSAIKLYLDAGFMEIEPYRYNPEKGARYFELSLKHGGA